MKLYIVKKLRVFISSIIVLISLISCSTNSLNKKGPSLEAAVKSEYLIQQKNLNSTNLFLIYGGVHQNPELILEQGYTHIMLGGTNATLNSSIPPQNRAILWTGIANQNKKAPFYKGSPWGNDLNNLRKGWKRRLSNYSDSYSDTNDIPNAAIICIDVEVEKYSSKEILSLRKTVQKKELNILSDTEFINQYKKDISSFFSNPIKLIRDYSPNVKISSYGDVPVIRNWHGINKYSWDTWKSEMKLTSYLYHNSNEFNSELDFLTPSAYFFYNREQNLSYLLFQIEVNKIWDDRPLILFITPRFVGKQLYDKPIPEHLAEAMAIFPFFAGAKGLWLWEHSKNRVAKPTEEILAVYSAFNKAFKRIIVYRDFFEDEKSTFVTYKSAHAHFLDKDIIWRGIVRNNKILIAAHNPSGKPGKVIEINVNYQNWTKTIPLKGKEVFLEEFNLN